MVKGRKELARKIACGLLAVAFAGIGGSAMANDIGQVIVDGAKVIVTPNGTFTVGQDASKVNITNDGWALRVVDSSSDVAHLLGQNISIKSENSAGAILGGYSHLCLGNDSTEKITIDSADDGIRVIRGYADIKAKEINFNIRGTGCAAIWLQNNTEADTAPANASTVNMTADTINITAADTGLVAFSNGQLNINGDIVVNAPIALNVRGVSTTKINEDGVHKTILNGDIVFATPNSPGDSQNSGKKINANVLINLNGKGSSWTGRAYQEYKVNGNYIQNVNLEGASYNGNVTGFTMNISNGAAWNMTGDSFINNVAVGENGAINISENTTLANVKNATLNGGTINFEGDNQKVNVTNLSGKGTVSTDSLSNNVNVASLAANTSVSVLGSGNIADAIQQNSNTAQKLADVVTSGTDENKKSVASEIKTEEGKVGGAYYAKVDKDGKIETATMIQKENTTNRAITDLASLSLMTWRAENNDMNKRLGELRASKGEQGAWARMARGESKYGAQGIKNQYNYYQVGYDKKLSSNSNWTIGAALSRTEGKSSFVNGSGENKHTGFAVYGSYLSDNGNFLDVIAKFARLDNDYKTTTGAGSGDYDTNGYSFSAEYGKRFSRGGGLWIEPQAELTYGRVSAADYMTANQIKVRQDAINSLVGRLGFALGKDIKRGNVYVRASYLYDFDGETEVKMFDTESGAAASYKQDLGGSWWEVGVGTNFTLGRDTHLYIDLEKTYSGNVATPWQWNAGVRWSF